MRRLAIFIYFLLIGVAAMRMGNFWAYIAVLPVFSLLYWLAEYLDDAEE